MNIFLENTRVNKFFKFFDKNLEKGIDEKTINKALNFEEKLIEIYTFFFK